MIETIIVPENRKNIINKKVASKIKAELNVSIKRKGNVVLIDGEGLEFLQAKSIIMAIGRGFSPIRAYRLLDEEQELCIIDIGKHSRRIRSRLIGTNGKTRKFVEEKTGSFVSVQGKTVSIIGNWNEIEIAKKAIIMLIDGISHSYVYRWLSKTCKK